jgi:hypothetical protein
MGTGLGTEFGDGRAEHPHRADRRGRRHGDLVTTARTYTHVVADEAELDYPEVLP